ncbi:MAG TPA: inorganic diphosphatase [Pirellulales bacterium]|jgi:inorganic pyrophosphatase|nr:inorganic diphosphatase [Pirellulales bacterium]
MRNVTPVDDRKKLLNVIVETPKGRRNKFKYDEARDCFKLSKVLPAGTAFPFDFGFLPQTAAPDGDPLDVVLLMDEQAFPGCLVQARVIGIIQAEQGRNGRRIRNDRIIAVAAAETNYKKLRSHRDIDPRLLTEYEHFFVSYHSLKGKKYHIRGVHGPRLAMRILKRARQRFHKTK